MNSDCLAPSMTILIEPNPDGFGGTRVAPGGSRHPSQGRATLPRRSIFHQNERSHVPAPMAASGAGLAGGELGAERQPDPALVHGPSWRPPLQNLASELQAIPDQPGNHGWFSESNRGSTWRLGRAFVTLVGAKGRASKTPPALFPGRAMARQISARAIIASVSTRIRRTIRNNQRTEMT